MWEDKLKRRTGSIKTARNMKLNVATYWRHEMFKSTSCEFTRPSEEAGLWRRTDPQENLPLGRDNTMWRRQRKRKRRRTLRKALMAYFWSNPLKVGCISLTYHHPLNKINTFYLNITFKNRVYFNKKETLEDKKKKNTRKSRQTQGGRGINAKGIKVIKNKQNHRKKCKYRDKEKRIKSIQDDKKMTSHQRA